MLDSIQTPVGVLKESFLLRSAQHSAVRGWAARTSPSMPAMCLAPWMVQGHNSHLLNPPWQARGSSGTFKHSRLQLRSSPLPPTLGCGQRPESAEVVADGMCPHCGSRPAFCLLVLSSTQQRVLSQQGCSSGSLAFWPTQIKNIQHSVWKI